jgi:hypothetical protein
MVYSRYEVRAVMKDQHPNRSNTSVHGFDVSESAHAVEQFHHMTDSGRFVYVCLIDIETGETLGEWNSE